MHVVQRCICARLVRSYKGRTWRDQVPSGTHLSVERAEGVHGRAVRRSSCRARQCDGGGGGGGDRSSPRCTRRSLRLGTFSAQAAPEVDESTSQATRCRQAAEIQLKSVRETPKRLNVKRLV